ncbi:MAG: NUDIX hydrolase, partial [Planctomycetota bacterium]
MAKKRVTKSTARRATRTKDAKRPAGPTPALAVDVVVLTTDRGRLRCVLNRRTSDPGNGTFALPGGFVRIDESLDEAAQRLLETRAGLEGVFSEQLYTFGAVGRDPRGRIVTVTYYALVSPARFAEVDPTLGAVTATLRVDWPGETGGPVSATGEEDAESGVELPLFLDHDDVLGMAVKRMRGKLDYTPVGFQLLPKSFTLRQLQAVHETIRGEPLNKASFRRRMLASGNLEA